MRLFIAISLYIMTCALWAQEAINKNQHIELVSVSYPPYHDQSLPKGGFVTEIVRQIFLHKNYQVDIDFHEAKRAFEVTKFNLADGIFMLQHTMQYDDNFYFSKPILYINLNLLGLKNNPKLSVQYTDPAQLKVLTIAVSENCVLPEVLEDDSFNIQTTMDDKSAIWMLLAGKVDLVLIDEKLSHYLIHDTFKETQDKMFLWASQPIAQIAQYFAVSKKHLQAKKIIFTFNSGLDDLKTSGIYDKLIATVDQYY